MAAEVEAATAGAVVSTEEALVVAVSMVVDSTGEASGVALSTTVVVSVADASAVVVSTGVAFMADVLVGETFAITDSLMMSSSAASAFQDGGAGTIRTDITVTAITRTVIMVAIQTVMDTAGTRTAMDTAGTATTVVPVMDIAMEVERVTDMGMATEPIMDTAMVAEQGIPGVLGVGS